jgi:hypothetical protein
LTAKDGIAIKNVGHAQNTCTVYTKDGGSSEAVLITHGGQPKDGRTLPIPAGMTLKYYGYDGEFKKFSFKDILEIVEKGHIRRCVELRTRSAYVRDYEFEPYELLDPRPNAPLADVFWGGAHWPIILPTEKTRLSKVLETLVEKNLRYTTLHCFHCRVSVATMKSWNTTASIVS